jgi:hypothetical protein
MQLECNGKNEVVITGNIKSVDDSIKIKDTINGLMSQGAGNIQLKIIDSLSLTSTAIGFLMKLVNQDKLQLSVTVGDRRLYTLLEELCLLQKFNVHLSGSRQLDA